VGARLSSDVNNVFSGIENFGCWGICINASTGALAGAHAARKRYFAKRIVGGVISVLSVLMFLFYIKTTSVWALVGSCIFIIIGIGVYRHGRWDLWTSQVIMLAKVRDGEVTLGEVGTKLRIGETKTVYFLMNRLLETGVCKIEKRGYTRVYKFPDFYPTKPKSARYTPSRKVRERRKLVEPRGKFCSYCKLELPADSEFCPECGRKVRKGG